MLERLVCNTYCVELHRPEGDRFSVVRIQILALPVRSHLAGFFKACVTKTKTDSNQISIHQHQDYTVKWRQIQNSKQK